MVKGNSSINLTCSSLLDFYKKWLLFIKPLEPISKLGTKPMEALAVLLTKRYEISKGVTEPKLIPQLLFSVETRNCVMESIETSKAGYYNLISLFKSIGVIQNGDLNRRIIPDISNNKFTLLVAFNINETD